MSENKPRPFPLTRGVVQGGGLLRLIATEKGLDIVVLVPVERGDWEASLLRVPTGNMGRHFKCLLEGQWGALPRQELQSPAELHKAGHVVNLGTRKIGMDVF